MSMSVFDQKIEAVQQWLTTLEQRVIGSGESLVMPALLSETILQLATTMEELQVAGEELRQSNEALAAAHQAVEAERQRYQELFDFAPDGYLVTNAEGVIQEANRAAVSRLGVRQDFLIGKPLTVFVVMEDRQNFRTRLSRLLAERGQATSGQVWEIRLQPRDNPPFDAALTVTPILTAKDQVAGWRWLVRDITERKRAQAALAEERNLLRTLIDNLPDTVFVKDTQHRFILGNIALVHSLAVATPDELIGQTDFDFHPPDLAAQYYADEETIFQSGQPLINREELVVYPGNEQHCHLTTKVPLRNGHDQIIGLVGIARDITQRKHMEEQLREGHQFIQKVADTSPHLIYIFDLVEQRNVYVNDRTSTILGYTPAEIQNMGAHLVEDLLHPDDYTSLREHFSKLAGDTTGGIFENEYRLKQANGEWRWFRSRDVVFTRTATGLPQQILGAAEDITERKHLRDAYQMLVEHSLQGLAIFEQTGQDFRLVFANPGLTRIGGYTPLELMSMSSDQLKALIHPEDQAFVWKYGRAHFSRKPISSHLEFRFICKAGLVRWVETFVSRIEYRGKPAIQATVIDITERKQAEEALQQSEARLDGIISTATDAIITIDADQQIVLFNGAAEQVFGYKADEVIGQRLDLLLPKRFRQVHVQYVQQFSQTGVTARRMGVMPGELWGRRIDGSEFPLEAMISQVEISGQKFYTVILHDITERKRIEQEKAQLFEAVSQQREQLRALARQLAEAQEAERKELARELHDRIDQNLTALDLNLNIIWAQIAETSLGTGLIQARLDDSLGLIAETAKSIQDVMADLRPPVLDDYGLVEALRWYSARLASRVSFSIRVDGEEPVPRLASSVESTLFRIAQEALTNVAKYAQASQVMITIEVDNGTMRMVVADDGVGFEPAHQTKPVERQGWGLITMIERAEAIGGRCRIVSQPGHGTQLIVEVNR